MDSYRANGSRGCRVFVSTWKSGGGGLSIDRSTKPRFEVREIDMAAAIAVLASFLLARIPPPSRVVVVVVVVVGIIAWD